MKRVAIIGAAGAGKSTLARKLGEVTGLPVIHLDRERWLPGRRLRPADEWAARAAGLFSGDEWVMDGVFLPTLGKHVARVEAIVFLDYGTVRCMRGLVVRRIRNHNRSRADMPEGLRERLPLRALGWPWRYRRTTRPQVLDFLADARSSGKTVVVLRSDRDARRFVEVQRATFWADEAASTR